MSKEAPQDMILQDDLVDHPKVAEAVGRYMAAFSCLEQDIFIFFGSVLGSDYTGATKLLSHIQSFTARIDAMENFLPHAKNLRPGGVHGGGVIVAMAREANAYRNKLVHGTFVIGSQDRKLRLTTYMGSTGRKSQTKLISDKMIDDRRTMDIMRLMHLIHAWNHNQPFPKGILTTPTIIPQKNDEWR